MIKGFVFWTPYICMHTTCIFEELGKKYPVIVACQSEEYGDFGSLNLSHISIRHISDSSDVEEIIQATKDYVHVNGCFKTYPEIEVFGFALDKIIREKCFVITLYQEQFQWWGMKGLLRRIQWFLLFNIKYRKIKAIGCTGTTGIEAYHNSLVPSYKLFDFPYSVPSPDSYLLGDNEGEFVLPVGKGTKFVMVGQIANRKCVLEVVRTFKKIKGDYTLYLLGGGPQEDELKAEIADEERIYYLGKVLPAIIRKVLKQTDVLIQASHLEGWGCTTNEALLYGNKVIISDAVGSRALILEHKEYGKVFQSGNWQEFANNVEYYISEGVNSADKANIAKWAECLYPGVAADYLERMLMFYMKECKVKPIAPWVL